VIPILSVCSPYVLRMFSIFLSNNSGLDSYSNWTSERFIG